MKRDTCAQTFVLLSLLIFSKLALATPAQELPRPDAHMSWTNMTLAHLFWEAPPAIGKSATIRLEFVDPKSHRPIQIEALPTVELFMPEMGHGSSLVKVEHVVDRTKKFNTSVFRFSNLNFFMAGEWEVQIELRFPNGLSESKTLPVQLR